MVSQCPSSVAPLRLSLPQTLTHPSLPSTASTVPSSRLNHISTPYFGRTYEWLKDGHPDAHRIDNALGKGHVKFDLMLNQAYAPSKRMTDFGFGHGRNRSPYLDKLRSNFWNQTQDLWSLVQPQQLNRMYDTLSTTQGLEGFTQQWTTSRRTVEFLMEHPEAPHHTRRLIHHLKTLHNITQLVSHLDTPGSSSAQKLSQQLASAIAPQEYINEANNWLARSADGIARRNIHVQRPGERTFDALGRNWIDFNAYSSPNALNNFTAVLTPLWDLTKDLLNTFEQNHPNVPQGLGNQLQWDRRSHELLSELANLPNLDPTQPNAPENVRTSLREISGILEDMDNLLTAQKEAEGQRGGDGSRALETLLVEIKDLIGTTLREAGLIPVSDVTVVGLGPAGLSMMLHAAHEGLRVSGFESGLLGQAFSDQGASSVHYMRTSRETTTLAIPGISPPSLSDQYAIANVLEQNPFIARGNRAREAMEGRTGIRFIGEPDLVNYQNRTDVPLERNVFFQYTDYIGDELANNPNAILSELSPVESVKELPNGYFEVKSRTGYTEYTRFVTLANGLTGEDSQYGRIPSIFTRFAEAHPDQFLTLENHDQIRSPELAPTLSQYQENLVQGQGQANQMVILSDALLGTDFAWRWIRNSSEGSRFGVVGSGESAVKAVIEMLIKSTKDGKVPQISVDLFMKERLEPYQIQVQPNAFDLNLLLAGLVDPTVGEGLRRYWAEHFNTPVTPQTMHDILQLFKDGHVRVFEMGSQGRFDDQSIRLEIVPGLRSGRLQTHVRVISPDVLAHLIDQQRTWNTLGLQDGNTNLQLMSLDDGSVNTLQLAQRLIQQSHGQGVLISTIDGGFVTAAGYDRASRQQNPLLAQMTQDGLIEFLPETNGRKQKAVTHEIALGPDRLTSAQHPRIGIVGAANFVGSASDSAIPGAAARAALLTQVVVNDISLPTLARVDDRFSQVTGDPTNTQRLHGLNLTINYENIVDSFNTSPGSAASIQTPILGSLSEETASLGIDKLREALAASDLNERGFFLTQALTALAFPQHEVLLENMIRKTTASCDGSDVSSRRLMTSSPSKQHRQQMQTQADPSLNRPPVAPEMRLMSRRALGLLNRVVSDPQAPGVLRSELLDLIGFVSRFIQDPTNLDFLNEPFALSRINQIIRALEIHTQQQINSSSTLIPFPNEVN